MGRRIAIVLITWNSAEWMPRCLDGIRAQNLGDESLVVVDNASSDDALSIVSKECPGATVIRNDRNLGFSAAANAGIRATDSEFVLLLNPDARLEPGYAARLADAIEARGERCGAATGRLLRGRGAAIEPTGVVDSLGIRMTRNGRHLDIGAGESDPGDVGIRDVFGVSGAAALYRRAFLDDIAVGDEFLSEDFFAYREDADLAWRGRLRGWSAICDTGAVAAHVRRVTPDVRRRLPAEVNMHSVKNRFLLRIRNAGWRRILADLPFTLIRDLIVVGATLTAERSSLPAFSWLWRNRARILAQRREIQSRRTVGDGEIGKWFR